MTHEIAPNQLEAFLTRGTIRTLIAQAVAGVQAGDQTRTRKATGALVAALSLEFGSFRETLYYRLRDEITAEESTSLHAADARYWTSAAETLVATAVLMLGEVA